MQTVEAADAKALNSNLICIEHDNKTDCYPAEALVKLEDLQTHHAQHQDIAKTEEINLKAILEQETQPEDCCGFSPPSVEGTGSCSASNPYVPMTAAPFVLVFDIFSPGVGTLVAAYYDPSGCNCKTITCGIFQILLSPVFVGWIWSIVQGCMIYNKSRQYYCATSGANYCT